MNLDRLMEYLKGVDEVQIMDLLGLTTEDILNRFEDVIIARRPFLERELELLSDTNDESEFDEDCEY